LATVTLFPYHYSSSLGPGEATWLSFGPYDPFGNSALSVTAMPGHGIGGEAHVLKIENINITDLETVEGDISFQSFYAGFSVMNNGGTTITEWTVWLGLINP
jgi:hypothetical protein